MTPAQLTSLNRTAVVTGDVTLEFIVTVGYIFGLPRNYQYYLQFVVGDERLTPRAARMTPTLEKKSKKRDDSTSATSRQFGVHPLEMDFSMRTTEEMLSAQTAFDNVVPDELQDTVNATYAKMDFCESFQRKFKQKDNHNYHRCPFRITVVDAKTDAPLIGSELNLSKIIHNRTVSKQTFEVPNMAGDMFFSFTLQAEAFDPDETPVEQPLPLTRRPSRFDNDAVQRHRQFVCPDTQDNDEMDEAGFQISLADQRWSVEVAESHPRGRTEDVEDICWLELCESLKRGCHALVCTEFLNRFWVESEQHIDLEARHEVPRRRLLADQEQDEFNDITAGAQVSYLEHLRRMYIRMLKEVNDAIASNFREETKLRRNIRSEESAAFAVIEGMPECKAVRKCLSEHLQKKRMKEAQIRRAEKLAEDERRRLELESKIMPRARSAPRRHPPESGQPDIVLNSRARTPSVSPAATASRACSLPSSTHRKQVVPRQDQPPLRKLQSSAPIPTQGCSGRHHDDHKEKDHKEVPLDALETMSIDTIAERIQHQSIDHESSCSDLGEDDEDEDPLNTTTGVLVVLEEDKQQEPTNEPVQSVASVRPRSAPSTLLLQVHRCTGIVDAETSTYQLEIKIGRCIGRTQVSSAARCDDQPAVVWGEEFEFDIEKALGRKMKEEKQLPELQLRLQAVATDEGNGSATTLWETSASCQSLLSDAACQSIPLKSTSNNHRTEQEVQLFLSWKLMLSRELIAWIAPCRPDPVWEVDPTVKDATTPHTVVFNVQSCSSTLQGAGFTWKLCTTNHSTFSRHGINDELCLSTEQRFCMLSLHDPQSSSHQSFCAGCVMDLAKLGSGLQSSGTISVELYMKPWKARAQHDNNRNDVVGKVDLSFSIVESYHRAIPCWGWNEALPAPVLAPGTTMPTKDVRTQGVVADDASRYQAVVQRSVRHRPWR